MAKRRTPTHEVIVDRTVIDRIASPLALDKLPKPETPEVRLIVTGRLDGADARKLARYAARYATSTVSIPHYPSKKYSLEFLRHFPFLQGFDLYDYNFGSPEELAFLPRDLRSLTLGQTLRTRIDLRFLERLTKLETLSLERHADNIESVGSLPRLRDLTLRSITLPDLSCLTSLKRLQSLDMKLGGTTNLDLIPRVGRLRYLELWLIRGLANLDWLPRVRTLQYLFLEALRNVVRLPSLKPLRQLRRVHLQRMQGLHQLQPVADAPNLQELELIGMGHLTAGALAPFVEHKSLRRVTMLLGSKRKNSAAQAVLPLPPVSEPFKFR